MHSSDDSHTPSVAGPIGTTERVLTLQEAAKILGVHPNTLRGYVRAGVVPGAKIGRDWRFVEADLVASLRARYPEQVRVRPNAEETAASRHLGNAPASTVSRPQREIERELDELLASPMSRGPKTSG